MQSGPDIPTGNNSPSESGPPIPPITEPPVIGALPLLGNDAPPPLPLQPNGKPWLEQMFAILLSLCLGLFLADAVVSLADDSLILFDLHFLSGVRGIFSLLIVLMAILVYGLMGFTPMIPKRLFLPLTLFNVVAGLVVIPVMIYAYSRIQQVALGVSVCEVILGFGILHCVQGGFKLRWPLIAEDQLQTVRFSWRNLFGFLSMNIFVLLPAVVAYLLLCAVLAVDHLSDGFVTLRSDGLIVQARKYVRADGKRIQLFPMSHVGDAAFYWKLSQSFPTNSVVLMEGVSDRRNLLTNKISYQKMAASLGVAEQQKEFQPRGKMVRADVDIEQFSPSTIDLLNLVMLIHAKGVTPESMLKLSRYSEALYFQERLWDDLLRKRNRRLLEEIQIRLPEAENIIIPWGAAHMPEIAKEIQKSGFRLDETHEYVAIRFRCAEPPAEDGK